MRELKQKIIDLCNNSGLSLEAISFVVRDVYRDVEETLKTFEENQKNVKESENNDN